MNLSLKLFSRKGIQNSKLSKSKIKQDVRVIMEISATFHSYLFFVQLFQKDRSDAFQILYVFILYATVNRILCRVVSPVVRCSGFITSPVQSVWTVEDKQSSVDVDSGPGIATWAISTCLPPCPASVCAGSLCLYGRFHSHPLVLPDSKWYFRLEASPQTDLFTHFVRSRFRIIRIPWYSFE